MTTGLRIELEWGLQGLLGVAQDADAVVIVDVLSFSTCVDIACSRGAFVLPCVFKDDAAAAMARERGAWLAVRRGLPGLSLSPASLQAITAGTRLVLPSPNGSMLSERASAKAVYAGCLRNADAIARALTSLAGRIVVLAAGEQWPDGSLRVALEDLLGAGAIIAALDAHKSPEAFAAQAAFFAHRSALHDALKTTASGLELIERGFGDDVAIATDLNASAACPQLIDGAYRNMNV
jgi:2-phosphosulfolactate phosphatase